MVEDVEVRAKLTPSDPFGTKRPLISAKYYPMYNLPQVELVTEAIDKVADDAITTVDGVTRQLDTIIVATGFATTKYLSAIEVTGRGGTSLTEAWSDGPQAYLGLTTSGFPNLFMLYGPNTNNGSIIFMIECQVGYLVRQLERMRDEHIVWMDLRPEVQERYNDDLQHDLDKVPVWSSEFHNYYRATPSGRIVTQWPHTMAEYRTRTSTPDPDAYEVHRGGRPTFA